MTSKPRPSSTINQPNSTQDKFRKSNVVYNIEGSPKKAPVNEEQGLLYKLMESSIINESKLPFTISDKFYTFLLKCNFSNIFSGSKYEKYVTSELVCDTKEIVYKIIISYIYTEKLSYPTQEFTVLDRNLCELFEVPPSGDGTLNYVPGPPVPIGGITNYPNYVNNQIIILIGQLFINNKPFSDDKLPFTISAKFNIFLHQCDISNIFSGSQYEKYIKLELDCKTKETVYNIIREYMIINKLKSYIKQYTTNKLDNIKQYTNKLDNKLSQLFGISYSKHTIYTDDQIMEFIRRLFIDDKLSIDKFQLPTDNINISFIGGVSTGKSTILNTIFCEQLTQCKIKRTTMIPTIYIENTSLEVNVDEIYKTIESKNNELIKKTENREDITKDEYNELTFNVGKLDINIVDDSTVKIYDIPGLNDARTKNLYYEYLRNNFHKLNLIIFVVDIYSGLNTSDEVDILNFIIENTKYQLEKNNKKIYTMVIVNKADDLQIQDDKLILIGELNEMFTQVEKTVKDEFDKNNITENLIDIIPLCALDTYLYRMVKKHQSNFKLSSDQILKIGINENGKKFSTLPQHEQEKKVYEILNDTNFIDTMIKLSGFSYIEESLRTFFNENSKKIRLNNLFFELNRYNSICSYFTDIENIYSDDFKIFIEKVMCIYDMIKKIDFQEYNNLMKTIIKELVDIIKLKKLNKYIDIDKLINDYDNIKNNILKIYFNDYYDTSDYPLFIKKYVYKLIVSNYNQTPSVNNFLNCIKYIQQINYYTVDIINSFIKLVMTPKELLFDNLDNDLLITELDKLNKLNINLIEFLRFINLHKIKLSLINNNNNLLFIKLMLYNKYNEIPLYNYLSQIIDISKVNEQVIIDGLNINLVDAPLELDIYYLKLYQSTNI